MGFAFLLPRVANKDGPDNALASHEQALSYWLHTPHADDRPKVLELGVPSYTNNKFVDMMESFKKFVARRKFKPM
ncbi:hypothetical protein GPALN_013262 [Globodera pallida]|nr:hypothetical protein GPALN_013262 [Globodera pallida]